jgi:mono/diheme cytochrome c family protein
MADYLVPAVALAALVASSAVLAQSVPGDPVEGEKLAREICATCHEVDKGQYGISLEGAPAFQDVMTSLALRVFLRSPHEWMPDLMLSETETDDVIAYILSLK